MLLLLLLDGVPIIVIVVFVVCNVATVLALVVVDVVAVNGDIVSRYRYLRYHRDRCCSRSCCC